MRRSGASGSRGPGPPATVPAPAPLKMCAAADLAKRPSVVAHSGGVPPQAHVGRTREALLALVTMCLGMATFPKMMVSCCAGGACPFSPAHPVVAAFPCAATEGQQVAYTFARPLAVFSAFFSVGAADLWLPAWMVWLVLFVACALLWPRRGRAGAMWATYVRPILLVGSRLMALVVGCGTALLAGTPLSVYHKLFFVDNSVPNLWYICAFLVGAGGLRGKA